MKQIALDIGLAPGPTLKNFFAGPNLAALQHMQLWVGSDKRSPVPTYVWGESGSGKTHLLRAVQASLRDQGCAVGWMDASVAEPTAFEESWRVVILDDVHLYTAVQQHAAFNWFVNATTPSDGQQRWVLAAGSLPPSNLPRVPRKARFATRVSARLTRTLSGSCASRAADCTRTSAPADGGT